MRDRIFCIGCLVLSAMILVAAVFCGIEEAAAGHWAFVLLNIGTVILNAWTINEAVSGIRRTAR